MSCMSLPDTGSPAATWLIAALVCLVAGLVLLRRRREGIHHVVSRTALVGIAVGYLVFQPSPGQEADDCHEPDDPHLSEGPHALVITQTSTIEGLAPTVAPVAIAGTVTNTSRDSTYIAHVTVRISSITRAEGSGSGSCSAADYVVSDSRMAVERGLPEFSSLRFSGASIGFRNSSHNQDACKQAIVHLAYVSGSR